MRYLKSAGAAIALFVGLGATLALFWTVMLGPVMDGVWDRLPEGVDRWVGAGLIAFAVLSGLAAYFLVLARIVRQLGAPPGTVRWHLLTTGLLPPLLAALALWAIVANLRFGW
jgi:hypothetical protein